MAKSNLALSINKSDIQKGHSDWGYFYSEYT